MEDWRLDNILHRMHSIYQEKAQFVLFDSWPRDCQLPKNEQKKYGMCQIFLLWTKKNNSHMGGWGMFGVKIEKKIELHFDYILGVLHSPY